VNVEIPDELVARIRERSTSPASFVTAAIEHRLALVKANTQRRRRGSPRYGFKLERRGLVPNVDEQAAITLIKRLRGQKNPATYRAIALELEIRGIKPRGGGHWHPNAVRRIHLRGNKPH
jgi:hypothetical protein